MELAKLYARYTAHPSVSIDTRTLQKGDVFFALTGPNFNGNEYAQEALDKGASLAVINDPWFEIEGKTLLVEDVLKTLQALANHHRRQLKTEFIAITGTNGKTTTKELLNAVLSTQFKTLCTAGNLNNHIGVPLTILKVQSDHKFAIIEMGANHVGEIAELCKIAEPEFGLITNVGLAHLEGFKNFEGVKKAKGELYKYLKRTKGTCFVNDRVPHLKDMLPRGSHTIMYGQGAFEVGDNSELNVMINWFQGKEAIKIQSQLTGAVNAENILTAYYVGSYFDVSEENLKSAIENYKPENNRSQVLKLREGSVLLDAYNANPTSMRISIENLATAQNKNKRVVLGDMLELGEDSLKYHQEVVNCLVEKNMTEGLLVGSSFKEVEAPASLMKVDSVKQAKEIFETWNLKDTVVLIKGSRAICLEKLVK